MTSFMTAPHIQFVRCDLPRHRLQSVRTLHRPVTRGAVDERHDFVQGKLGNKCIPQPRGGFRFGLPLLAHRDIWPIATYRVAARVVQPHELDRYLGKANVGFVASRCLCGFAAYPSFAEYSASVTCSIQVT